MPVPKLLFGYPIDRSSCFIPFNTGCAALPALVWKLELPGMRSQGGHSEQWKYALAPLFFYHVCVPLDMPCLPEYYGLIS